MREKEEEGSIIITTDQEKAKKFFAMDFDIYDGQQNTEMLIFSA